MKLPASIEFFNIHPEFREDGGWQLPRYPAKVRHDVLHPSESGHAQMGHHLAERLQRLI